MNISFKNGKRSITLTKTERSQMSAARAVCGELYKQTDGATSKRAGDAAMALGGLLASFGDDAVQSEPEATTTKGT